MTEESVSITHYLSVHPHFKRTYTNIFIQHSQHKIPTLKNSLLVILPGLVDGKNK